MSLNMFGRDLIMQRPTVHLKQARPRQVHNASVYFYVGGFLLQSDGWVQSVTMSFHGTQWYLIRTAARKGRKSLRKSMEIPNTALV